MMDVSVDEFIATLRRSSLPTIIVEGIDDIVVYRYFEERLSRWGVSLMPVGGRQMVIDIFKRRGEFSAVKLAFVADMDFFVHSGVPADLVSDELIFTDGYSVENDVFRDGCLERLLKVEEREKFSDELAKFLRWYALALSRYLAGSSESISLHPERVLSNYDDLIVLVEGEVYPDALLQSVQDDYRKLLRGKSLMPLLVRRTNYKGRVPRHNSHALLEIVAARPGKLLNGLFNRITGALGLEVELADELF